MKQQLRISVRDLVEFLERSGDLDSGAAAEGDAKIMQAGSRLHRKIQGRMGSGYHAEVPLKYRKEWERFSLLIEGRADGIWTEEAFTTIDEIKGTFLGSRPDDGADAGSSGAGKMLCVYLQRTESAG